MEKEIKISDVVGLILSKKWIILSCVLLCAIGTYVYSAFFVDPVYTSTGKLYVSNVQDKRNNNVELSEMTTSARLVNTYVEILKSEYFTNKIAEEVNLGYSGQEIKKMLSMASINNTEILQININCEDPNHAAAILNTILYSADEELIRVVKAGSVSIIDNGKVPIEPSAPNVMSNTVLGAILGAFLSAVIIIAILLLDVTVRSEDELSDKYGYPILGVIPPIKAERN